MKRSTLYYLFFLGIALISIYGFLVPYLLSSRDTFYVLLGASGIAIGLLGILDFIRTIGNVVYRRLKSEKASAGSSSRTDRV
jgi:membrane associated rhomboid family serine protease